MIQNGYEGKQREKNTNDWYFMTPQLNVHYFAWSGEERLYFILCADMNRIHCTIQIIMNENK